MKKAKVGVKKKFFEVTIPLLSTKAHLYGSEISQFENAVVTLDLSRNVRGKNLEMKARVTNENGSLIGKPMSLTLVPSYIRRSIRKGSDYVEDSFEMDCKDAVLIIKPFLLTRRKVSRAVRHALRVQAKKAIETHVRVRTAHEIMNDVITNKLQKEMFLKLKKIYPLAFCEIRILEITGKQPTAQPEEEKVPRTRKKKAETQEPAETSETE